MNKGQQHNQVYLFFKDEEIYKKSKYSLMINTHYPITFPCQVMISQVERDWQLPLLCTKDIGNPKIKEFTEEEFNKTFEVKSTYYNQFYN